MPRLFWKDSTVISIPMAMAGYNKVPHVTRCGCWAHLRRKFVEAMPPESNASTPAQIGRDLCDQLFAAEKEIQSFPPEQRQEKHLAVEQPMLRAFGVGWMSSAHSHWPVA